MDAQAFDDLHGELGARFPRIHAALQREVVNRHSLLYTWPGSDPSLDPVVLMGHLDVVPVEPGTEGDWTHPPFSGEVDGGYVWGRGTMDMKGTVVAVLHAVEGLLEEGFSPRRTVLLAFGHDEEVSGQRGAGAIVALLEQRCVRPAWVLDEGGAIVARPPVGTEVGPVALVGHGEKGYLTLELRVTGEGGHAAMPPAETSVGILARALTRLERRRFPVRLGQPVTGLLTELGKGMPFVTKTAVANQWLFRPVVARMMARAPVTASLVRTTTAITMVQAGTKDNVLAQAAHARVNFRILPGETTACVTERVRRLIRDPRVRIRTVGLHWDPTPMTPLASRAYATLSDAIQAVYPQVRVAPNLVNGATDARYFTRLCPHVFRFSPLVLYPDDTGRIHGTNERLSIEDLGAMGAFYTRLLRTATGEPRI